MPELRLLALALGLCPIPCAIAGSTFTQTSASYSVTATASGEFSDTQTSQNLGTVSLLAGGGVANRWEADARLVAFVNSSIEIGAGAESRTNTDSLVACSTQTSASVGFSIPASTLATIRSVGPGSMWQAVDGDGGTAQYTASLTGPGGVVFTRGAPETGEVFAVEAVLSPGAYTFSVSSSTSSVADGDPGTTSQGICTGGVRVEFAPAPACNPADLAEPFGTLDLADINAFVAAFVAMEPAADLVADGVYDLADINAFVTAFAAGCP
jgi:hypothetical protein